MYLSTGLQNSHPLPGLHGSSSYQHSPHSSCQHAVSLTLAIKVISKNVRMKPHANKCDHLTQYDE
jgi:hypothetical protein